ncbi:MAG: amino acid permease, partial [Xanthomonadales bacterium]|nr:amino acid permease [Xanthomonadales bacterium]MBP6692485.1 amino acid permease [Xanthomonadales bacterium]
MLFQRVKSLDQILATAEKKSLKRQLGPVQLTLLGVGAIIGTGIFVLTAEAGQKAGPAMMIAFVIAAVVCALAALAYAELASMIPVSGSAYTYTYGVLGEGLAWIVGWALVLEYAVAAGAVSVGWSGYMNGLLVSAGIPLPEFLRTGPYDGGSFNLLAFLIALAVTVLLVIGTSKSAKVNSVLVAIKVVALTAFIVIAIPAVKDPNFQPFMPTGWGSPMGGIGVLGAAASIFFAYVGFDAVSTAAEETRNPNRNIPIGLIGSLAVCTVFYLLVGYAAVGSVGSQPMMGPDGLALLPGSAELAAACKGSEALVCSKEPLAHVLRLLGFEGWGNAIGIAAALALPSVILMMLFGQTRIFFTMSRDGLLPNVLSKIHPTFHTPHVITLITGAAVSLFAAMFPVGILADISNSGTLFAFLMVAVGVMILRKTQPDRPRPFRTPMVWV